MIKVVRIGVRKEHFRRFGNIFALQPGARRLVRQLRAADLVGDEQAEGINPEPGEVPERSGQDRTADQPVIIVPKKSRCSALVPKNFRLIL